jgi:hypothetical protein
MDPALDPDTAFFVIDTMGTMAKGDIEVLEKVQEKAVKMVSGLRSKEYADRCAELGLETLEQRRQNQDMGLVYKLLNGEEESNLFTLANRPGAVRTRQTAGTKNIVAKFARTHQRKFSFSVRTVEKWSGLSEATKQAATQDGFKRSLKQTRQLARCDHERERTYRTVESHRTDGQQKDDNEMEMAYHDYTPVSTTRLQGVHDTPQQVTSKTSKTPTKNKAREAQKYIDPMDPEHSGTGT